MSSPIRPPRILIVDDALGRSFGDIRNDERDIFCAHYLIRDVTPDAGARSTLSIDDPIAEAVFHRGQTPAHATLGDTVENDMAATMDVVRSGWLSGSPWALVLLDLCFYTGPVTAASNQKGAGMPEGREADEDPKKYFGLRILEEIRTQYPMLPVVILSGKPRNEVSERFSSHGAHGFLPREDRDSPRLLREYIVRHGLIEDNSGEIVGMSRSLLIALRTARRVAQSGQNILIRGERGTGKELLARYIHRHGAGQKRPLIEVDSGRLNKELYASELFGHVKGAYTGAQADRTGRIVQADGGDLFLDEIGNMPTDVQMGLLRVLEDNLVVPLGATSGKPVDVRFISATNENVEDKAALGSEFRPDLLDRLREGGTLYMPPLRERREDIPLLAEKFLRDALKANPSAMNRTINDETMDALRSHSWPGNIRELRSCIFRAVTEHPDVEHLVPLHLHFDSQRVKSVELPARSEDARGGEKPHGQSSEGPTLDEAIRTLERVRFEPDQVAGRLPDIESAYAGLIARLLKVGLEATKKRTPTNPDGEVKYQPAMKLLTGRSKLTAPQAADLIKRLLNRMSNEELEGLLEDPILGAAYKRARRARSNKGKKKGSGS